MIHIFIKHGVLMNHIKFFIKELIKVDFRMMLHDKINNIQGNYLQ